MLLSERNQYSETFVTDEAGAVAIKRLAFGEYLLAIDHPGFAYVAQAIEIRSVLPAEYTLQLRLQEANTTVNVTGQDTLIDPHRAGSVNQIGTDTITSRGTALPGRALQDLVNSQPGWLYEGNAVLHPRGSEYQTQFVLDGIPLTDNRSPSFGPAMEADGVQSMSIYTAGIPAEYGRKMGGVVEVNTLRDEQMGP